MTKLVVYSSLILVLVVLLLQAYHPSWFNHMSIDVSVFYSRADYFINNLNFAQVNSNEYQPGALIFFALLSPILLINNSYITFTQTFFLANLFLVFLISFLYSKITNYKSIIIFSLILVFTGPIIFFRFELFAITFILLSLYFLYTQKYILSSISLAFATTIKLFPMVLLPYFLIKRYRSDGLMAVIVYFLTFFIATCLFISIFIFTFKSSLYDISNAINYHSSKSISIESNWATFITLIYTITNGTVPPLEANFRMWALDRNIIVFPVNFYNYFWVLPISLLYIWLLTRKSLDIKKDSIFLISLLLTFIVSSKVQAPQYLLWFTLLIPLISANTLFSDKSLTIAFFLILLVLFLTQFIYPLSFGNFLEFYKNGTNLEFFWINALRNILLLISLLIFLLKFKVSTK